MTSLPLIGNGVIAFFLVIGLLGGLRRGGIKEGAVLIGVLLGALLAEFWSERWGQTLSQRSGLNQNTATWLIALGLLLGTAILSGYGGSTLLRRSALRSSDRISGALLGLLNMGLLSAFTLRYTQQFYFNETNPDQPVESWIRSGPISRYMLDLIGLVLLGAAALVALSVIVALTIRLGRLATRPAPAKPSPAPASAPVKPFIPPAAPPATPKPAESPIIGAGQPNGPPKDLPPGKQEKFL